MKHYSQMTHDELHEEIRNLEKEELRARRTSMPFEEAVIRQKIHFAKSYLMDPDTILPGKWYEVEGEERLFQVDRLNGVMAWGRWENETHSSAVPIGSMKRVRQP
ncbi:DUF1811 family protein [Melghirimyces algeriensis]|uniref:Uncharacterized protein n=1 Tax=Melghirimyces algeriensis TaxID=910412 RepID=A0A521E2F7_9BACL|nr:DUF1811 family protein [Melghirimyces algeriensis]SMO78005.1 Protein of unknown function [Melghirimyces algeriensis]